MPANEKVFTEIKREKYDVFRQELREKSFVLPFGDNGYLRGRGLFADISYNEPDETITIRIRETPKGETYDSLFNQFEDVLQSIAV
jgi:hypothetical protein